MANRVFATTLGAIPRGIVRRLSGVAVRQFLR
jgi:hypothetical protein